MSSDKIFSKKEISQILTKASEIQMTDDTLSDQKEGISKEDLIQIGKEVGISPNVIEQAITSLKNTSHTKFNWLIGSSELQTKILIDHVVDDLQLDQLFPELNAYTGQKGNIEKVGKGYDWEQTENGLKNIRRITVVPKDKRTKIIHYVNWNDFRGLGLGLSAFFGALALALILRSFGIPKSTYLILSTLGALVGYFSFMVGLKFYFNKQKKKFESITKLITDTFSRPAQHRIGTDDEPYRYEESQDSNSQIKS